MIICIYLNNAANGTENMAVLYSETCLIRTATG